jgi:hypothetical protein
MIYPWICLISINSRMMLDPNAQSCSSSRVRKIRYLKSSKIRSHSW